MGNTVTRTLFLLLALMSSIPVHAGTIQLPQTGQISCFNATGESIPCAGTWQDGLTKIGATLPAQRFTDNNNGTLTDTLNGLIWLKNANCTETAGGIDKSNGSLTWQDALTWTNSLASGQCGYSGSAPGNWRLPNIHEIESLINREEADNVAWLTSMGFINARREGYWSSSTNTANPDTAWLVHMELGLVYAPVKAHLTDFYFVLPVRDGQ